MKIIRTILSDAGAGAGGGQFIHAPNSCSSVSYSDLILILDKKISSAALGY